MIPRQWKAIQTVREKFSCRECEKIAQPPAPFHVTPRGFAGPNLLVMILFEKFGQHQPLNRQSERYRREGIASGVWADTAYRSAANETFLNKNGFVSHIVSTRCRPSCRIVRHVADCRHG